MACVDGGGEGGGERRLAARQRRWRLRRLALKWACTRLMMPCVRASGDSIAPAAGGRQRWRKGAQRASRPGGRLPGLLKGRRVLQGAKSRQRGAHRPWGSAVAGCGGIGTARAIWRSETRRGAKVCVAIGLRHCQGGHVCMPVCICRRRPSCPASPALLAASSTTQQLCQPSQAAPGSAALARCWRLAPPGTPCAPAPSVAASAARAAAMEGAQAALQVPAAVVREPNRKTGTASCRRLFWACSRLPRRAVGLCSPPDVPPAPPGTDARACPACRCSRERRPIPTLCPTPRRPAAAACCRTAPWWAAWACEAPSPSCCSSALRRAPAPPGLSSGSSSAAKSASRWGPCCRCCCKCSRGCIAPDMAAPRAAAAVPWGEAAARCAALLRPACPLVLLLPRDPSHPPPAA